MKFKTLSAAALLIAASLCTALCSCSDDPENNAVTQNVSVESDPDNALRYPVSVTASADCDISVTYWPTAEPELRRTTEAVRTQGNRARINVMFVRAETDYTFNVNINGRAEEQRYSFTTGSLPPGVPSYNVAIDEEGAPADGYLMQWQATSPGWITFCDMKGRVVWYEKFDQAIRMAFYNPELKKMAVLTGFRDGVNSRNFQRLADKIITLDLEGHRDVSWTASADNVPYPHHDIKFRPDGSLIIVCNFIKRFNLSQFDLGDDEEVWGDGFTIITPGSQVVKTWDNFGELTPFNSGDVILERGAVKDFLHANSVNWDSDGNYYMTFNRLSQLWKIDAATGKVLYRVGPGGNVAMDADDYASGLHCAEPIAPDKVLCYDNGESRGYSRAVIYEIDPQAMTAKATLKVPIAKEYSSLDRSNVQLIRDGRMLMFCNTLGRNCVFTDLEGKVLKVISRTGISYRAYYFDEL